jgi:MoxR-like ATPase
MTKWQDVLNGDGFRSWLDGLAGARWMPQGEKLDPFSTSLRRSGLAAKHLARIQAGELPDCTDPKQAITDLMGMRLVHRDDKVALTEMGCEVLTAWQTHGVCDESTENEVARCLLLLRTGLAFRDELYVRMMVFWRELRHLYDGVALINRPYGLYLLSYLNQNINGFNPWSLLKSLPHAVPTDTDLELETIKTALSGAGVKLEVEPAASKFAGTIAGVRVTGRRDFCLAMELNMREPHAFREALRTWPQQGLLDQKAVDGLLRLENVKPGGHPDRLSVIEELLYERHNVVLYGPPGTGKTRAAFQLRDRWEQKNGDGSVRTVTFHPSYSYEDFVQGFRPHEEDAGVFTLQSGVFLDVCKAAKLGAEKAQELGTPAPKMLLVIDEINRGDTARIFGELITFIESDKRGVEFRLAQQPEKTFSVPINLFLLGTMNTADRSVSLMDVAFRRRFAFLSFPAQPELITETSEWLSSVEGVDLAAVLRGLNLALLEEGIESDRAVGHAMLGISSSVTDPLTALRRRFELDIVPLVTEYCMVDRRGAQRVLGALVDERGEPLSLPNDAFLQALRVLESRGNRERPGAPAKTT